MAELFPEIVGLFEQQPPIVALADRFAIVEADDAGRAVVLGVPIIVDALCRRLADPLASGRFLAALGSVDRAGIGDPAMAIRDGHDDRVGSQVLELALGPARPRVAAVIADEVGLRPDAVDGLLPVSAWALTTRLADRETAVARRSVMAELERAHRYLISNGWEAWMGRAAPPRPVSPRPVSPRSVASRPAATRPDPVRPTPVWPAPIRPTPIRHAPVRPSPTVGWPGPLRPPSALHQPGIDPAGPRPAAGPRPGPTPTPIGPRLAPDPNRSRPADLSPEAYPGLDPADDVAAAELEGAAFLWPYVGVLLFLLSGALGLLWLLGEPEAGIDAGDAQAARSAGRDEDAPLYVASGDDLDQAAGGPTGTVSIDVEMADPTGASSATGLAELRFDLVEGRLCYNITAEGIESPYDGHIHVGPAGVKGGIVIDFGSLANRVIDCLPIGRPAMEPILIDLDGHYVELHDALESFTIRAQLSEGTLADGSPAAGALEVDLSEPAADPGFDPGGDGAVAVIEEGRIIVEGPIADRATADRLLAEFSGVDGLAVIDELTIDAAAPLPSGRIRIDNLVLFADDSDRLTGAAFPIVADLALLLKARPDWSVTVVGHTDAAGDEVDNLELSLRQAEAVRAELVDNGIAPARLAVEGAGSTRPVGDNATPEGRSQNRRTEIEISRSG